MNRSCLADYHLHTEHSPDSDAAMAAMCNSAVQAGVKYIAITDHVEIPAFYAHQYDRTIGLSYAQAGGMQALFKGKLYVAKGIELGEPLHNLPYAESVLAQYKFDFILGSLHNLRDDKDFYHYDYTDFDVHTLMNNYFNEVLDMVRWGRFHSLAHITYPFRYIPVSLYQNDYSPWMEQINTIFRTMAEKGIALEINTSGLRQPIGVTLPDLNLVKRFRALGGERITVGSDAHFPEHVGKNIQDGIFIAKEAGFRHIAIFKEAKAEMLLID